MWAKQPEFDQIPLYDHLKEYVGLLSQFNDAISSSRAASQKVDEITQVPLCSCALTVQAELASAEEKAVVSSRRDIIHSLTLCEVFISLSSISITIKLIALLFNSVLIILDCTLPQTTTGGLP